LFFSIDFKVKPPPRGGRTAAPYYAAEERVEFDCTIISEIKFNTKFHPLPGIALIDIAMPPSPLEGEG
jgi:hypothetical protein